jgi:hypothetical protein
MWPILIGFMFGVVVYVAVMWVHNQYGTLNDILDDIRVPFWLRALLVLMTSAMCLAALFLFVHVWPPLTVTFEHTMKGWELFWAIFYGSNFLSVFLGFVLGIFVTDWVVDAIRKDGARRLGHCGIRLGNPTEGKLSEAVGGYIFQHSVFCLSARDTAKQRYLLYDFAIQCFRDGRCS